MEFPARNALYNMTDPEHESKQRAFDRSLMSGVLPYEVDILDIDSFPTVGKPVPERHAYITWFRQMKHGFTRGCAGCMEGHSRHNAECRKKFDTIFKKESPPLASSAGAPPTPGPVLTHEMPEEPPQEEVVRDLLDEPPSPIEYEPTTDEEDARPAAIARAVKEAKKPADSQEPRLWAEKML